MRSSLLLLGLAFVTGSPAFGHGGGLNAQGCHNNRKTGDYHCHRAASAPQAPRPVVSPPARGPASGVVKRSKSGICHAPGSAYYARTVHFTSFETLEACLASGGRMPLK